MTHFTVITTNYFNKEVEDFDSLIEKEEKALAKFYPKSTKAGREREIARLVKRKANEIDIMTREMQKAEDAKLYEGKAEFIIYGDYQKIKPMSRYYSVEEILKDETNVTYTAYIVPLGTYEKYQEAAKNYTKAYEEYQEAKKKLMEIDNLFK